MYKFPLLLLFIVIIIIILLFRDYKLVTGSGVEAHFSLSPDITPSGWLGTK